MTIGTGISYFVRGSMAQEKREKRRSQKSHLRALEVTLDTSLFCEQCGQAETGGWGTGEVSVRDMGIAALVCVPQLVLRREWWYKQFKVWSSALGR